MRTRSIAPLSKEPIITAQIPFLDLRIEDESVRRELLAAIDRVFCHGRIVMGPEVAELERAMALRCQRVHAVGVNSGTDAVFLACKSLGLKAGDEVITTSLSWIATANGIALTGATPVFADIRDDLNIDPASVARLIGPRTRAILPVHYTGKICDMDALGRLAQEHHLPIIEDAAQAFGAVQHGRPAGSFGTLACFSMNAMKVFAAVGEAGAVLTDDVGLYDRLVTLRYNGTINRETCVEVGLNARMDTVQAAILLCRLRRVDDLIQKRRQIARWYQERLADVVTVPVDADDTRDVYYTYTIQADRRDELKAYLEICGVETKIQHPILMPQQPAYSQAAKGEWANAQKLVSRILCIPVHEKLGLPEVEQVSRCIRDFYGGR